ncbi:MAG: hypothetical protein V7K26_35045 [Nostoc sp.]
MQVQILSGVPKYLGVAQMGAREFRKFQVVGSPYHSDFTLVAQRKRRFA